MQVVDPVSKVSAELPGAGKAVALCLRCAVCTVPILNVHLLQMHLVSPVMLFVVVQTEE